MPAHASATPAARGEAITVPPPARGLAHASAATLKGATPTLADFAATLQSLTAPAAPAIDPKPAGAPGATPPAGPVNAEAAAAPKIPTAMATPASAGGHGAETQHPPRLTTPAHPASPAPTAEPSNAGIAPAAMAVPSIVQPLQPSPARSSGHASQGQRATALPPAAASGSAARTSQAAPRPDALATPAPRSATPIPTPDAIAATGPTATPPLAATPAIASAASLAAVAPSTTSLLPASSAGPTTSSAGAAPLNPPQFTAAAPSGQIAPVLLRMGSANGSRHISMQLTPDSLGRVAITIDQPKDGSVTVRLTADHPHTLALLEQDKSGLAATLDRAGLPSADRVISFHLAAPHIASPIADTAAPNPGYSGPPPPSAEGFTAGSQPDASPRQPPQGETASASSHEGGAPTDPSGQPIDWSHDSGTAQPASLRGLLNITA